MTTTIQQVLIVPTRVDARAGLPVYAQFVPVADLEASVRGADGFGSSGL